MEVATTHKLFVNEGSQVESSTIGTFLEPRESYEVLKPLFKNGRQYSVGDIIELTKKTAEGFLQLNEIKEID